MVNLKEQSNNNKEIFDIYSYDNKSNKLYFDYDEDYFKYLLELEVKKKCAFMCVFNLFTYILYYIQNRYKIYPDFLQTKSSIINARMRSILIDWVIGVHSDLSLNQETLYLSVKIIDEHLQV
jgi:hypothetical protein